jgi:hypothetical protein
MDKKKIKKIKNIIDKLIPGDQKCNLPKGSKIISIKDTIDISHLLPKMDLINEQIVVKKFGEKLIHLYYGSPKIEKLIEKKLLTKTFLKKYYSKFDTKLLQTNKRKKIYKSL